MTNLLKDPSRKHFKLRGICPFTAFAAMGNNCGQALVELALLFPVFILLLVGAAEFGRLAYAAIEVSTAARAGVAYGAQSHNTASDYAGMRLAATQDAPDVTAVIATASSSCICSSGSTISCTYAHSLCPSPARIIEYVHVNTTATVDTMFHYPGLPHTYTLTGQATMRVEE